MKILKTNFHGLLKIKGVNYYDNRGLFREIFKNNLIKKKFILWCISKSKKKVIRGLHIQKKIHQNIIVSVVKGKIFDVVVDLRKNSKTFGKHYKIVLSDKNAKSVYVPPGFAHGFLGLEKENIISYFCTNYRSKKHEVGLQWNDKDLKIKWPIKKPIVSNKDKNNLRLRDFIKLYK